ncbi:hypothetical protein [Lacticaseibacillus jixiensis]|uniref:hypothetical protein n=1 Tax=Lacticaseibacillus jixiensis TaxID=3231926 RepID=UPI0036F410AA
MRIYRGLTTLLVIAGSALMLAACGNHQSSSSAASTKSASVAKSSTKASKAKTSSAAAAKAASSSKAKAAAESKAAAASAAKASSQAAVQAASSSKAKAAADSSKAQAASTEAANRAYALKHPINEYDEAYATLVKANLPTPDGWPKFDANRQDGSHIVVIDSDQSGIDVFQFYPQADQTVKIDCSYVTQPISGKDYATYPINKTVTIKRVGDPGNGYHY